MHSFGSTTTKLSETVWSCRPAFTIEVCSPDRFRLRQSIVGFLCESSLARKHDLALGAIAIGVNQSTVGGGQRRDSDCCRRPNTEPQGVRRLHIQSAPTS